MNLFYSIFYLNDKKTELKEYSCTIKMKKTSIRDLHGWREQATITIIQAMAQNDLSLYDLLSPTRGKKKLVGYFIYIIGMFRVFLDRTWMFKSLCLFIPYHLCVFMDKFLLYILYCRSFCHFTFYCTFCFNSISVVPSRKSK